MNKSDIVYLDYQASTPLCELAWKEMRPHFKESFANPHSTQHGLGLQAAASIEEARRRIASLIGADSSEIIFTSGATEANNLALIGYMARTSPKKKRILASSVEHKCILAACYHLKDRGYSIDFVPVDEQGIVRLDKLQSLLQKEDVAIVSIMAANNEIGSIQPVSECSELAHAAGAVFHTDAAQATLNGDVDVEEWDVDLLSLSGHKMFGPKGIGALYVSGYVRSKMEPIIFGGGQEGGLRSGTLPTPLCVGFGAAAQYLKQEGHILRQEIRRRRDYFWEKLETRFAERVTILGPALDKRHIGNLCVSFCDIDAEHLLGILQTEVAASTGSACTTGTPEPSHVLSAVGLPEEVREGAVRFSFGPETPLIQLDQAIDAIVKAVDQASM